MALDMGEDHEHPSSDVKRPLMFILIPVTLLDPIVEKKEERERKKDCSLPGLGGQAIKKTI